MIDLPGVFSLSGVNLFKRDNWMASWYIATRSAGLDGSLEFDWRETVADGSVVMHPSSSADKTELQLERKEQRMEIRG